MATILTVAFAFGSAVYAFPNKYHLLAVVIAFYIIIQRLLHWRRRHKYLNDATIIHDGVQYRLRALIDTGNALTDPMSQLPVNLISLPIFLQMFPEITADQILLHELDQKITSGHYLTCQTVNGRGKIFVFRPDKMEINGTEIKDCLLGVTAKNFSNSKYDALLNAKMGGLI